ncbi:MAG: hypothetical protein ACI4QD_08700 [Kiritimatiellia bacterium]
MNHLFPILLTFAALSCSLLGADAACWRQTQYAGVLARAWLKSGRMGDCWAVSPCALAAAELRRAKHLPTAANSVLMEFNSPEGVARTLTDAELALSRAEVAGRSRIRLLSDGQIDLQSEWKEPLEPLKDGLLAREWVRTYADETLEATLVDLAAKRLSLWLLSPRSPHTLETLAGRIDRPLVDTIRREAKPLEGGTVLPRLALPFDPAPLLPTLKSPRPKRWLTLEQGLLSCSTNPPRSQVRATPPARLVLLIENRSGLVLTVGACGKP